MYFSYMDKLSYVENSNNLFATIKEDHTEKEISLEEVDNKILTIDDFLKDFV